MTFIGTPPADKLLTAAMMAAGATVEYGTDATNGRYWRFEGGLQICSNALILTYLNASQLSAPWTFAKPFVNAPAHIAALVNLSLAANNFTIPKRGATLLTCNSFLSGTSGNVRLEGSGVFTGGDETCGVTAIAVGFWK